MQPLDPTLATSLERFVQAQDPVIETVLQELRAGQKRTHWMWFIFPQLQGLGRSSLADYYGLSDLAEARAYLAHEILGPRLRQCAGVLLTTGQISARDIFGSPDDLKLCSSMTLFAAIAEENSPFREVLAKYYENRSDPKTNTLLHS